MAEHRTFGDGDGGHAWIEPAGDGMSSDVEARVEGKGRSILLMIPKPGWDTIDIDMSIKCAKAVVNVLVEAVALAEKNKATYLTKVRQKG
jgi:hypothetical protein